MEQSLIAEIFKLQYLIQKNIDAYDDDLESTWEQLKDQWVIVENKMNVHLINGEG